MNKRKTLNEHLFDALERLSAAGESDWELEINKAASIISVSEQVLKVAKLKLEIIQSGNGGVENNFPEIDADKHLITNGEIFNVDDENNFPAKNSGRVIEKKQEYDPLK